MMTSHNWPEYQLPKTICGDILHHTVKVLSEILHYAVPDHSLWLLQYYGSLAWIPRLQQVIEAAGHKCYFLPKFHCELNPIKMYWGWVKIRKFYALCTRNCKR